MYELFKRTIHELFMKKIVYFQKNFFLKDVEKFMKKKNKQAITTKKTCHAYMNEVLENRSQMGQQQHKVKKEVYI